MKSSYSRLMMLLAPYDSLLRLVIRTTRYQPTGIYKPLSDIR